jgi:hypothetical protein
MPIVVLSGAPEWIDEPVGGARANLPPARSWPRTLPGSPAGVRGGHDGGQTFASTILPLESTVQFKVASRTSNTPFRSP